MVRTLPFILLLLTLSCLYGQERPADFLSSDFHKERRELFRKKMPSGSVAVFFSGAIRNRANDVDYDYHQDPDFYYLTGHREPHALLLIFKEMQGKGQNRYNELIVVRKKDALKELYDGYRLGKEGASKALGIEQVLEGPDFKKYDIDFSQFDRVIFQEFYNDVRDTDEEGDLYDLIVWFKQKAGYPDDSELTIEPKPLNLDTETADRILKQLRQIKTEEELQLLRKAVEISAVAQAEVMKAMRPGLSEREVQGIHEFVYRKYGAEHEGYPSIVGAGHNGCVLHYIDNYDPAIEDGQLILMDLGAEYRGYTADVTRTIPVNGKFTENQRKIYELVLKAQEAAWKECKAGAKFSQLSSAVNKVVNEGLVELGLYESTQRKDIVNPDTGRPRYNPHGCCHHIGLDVHDKGNYDVLQENMTITIEPGIYIPEGSPAEKEWWNIPVRIEDDFLIKKDGCELLSSHAPRTVEDIEKLMAQPSPFDAIILPELQKK